MRLKRIELKQVNQFAFLCIDLNSAQKKQPITLFLGEKNSGKTTVLKHIFQGLSWFSGRLKDPRTAGITLADSDIRSSAAQATVTIDIEYPAEFGTLGDQHAHPTANQCCSWQIKKIKTAEQALGLSRADTVDLEVLIARYQQQLQMDNLFAAPCIAYYPAERFVHEINLQSKNTSTSLSPLHNAYDLLSVQFATFNKFFEWFRDITDLENAQSAQLIRQYLNPNSQPYKQTSFALAFNAIEQAYRLSPQRYLNSLRTAIHTVLPEIDDIFIEFQPKLRAMVMVRQQAIPFSQLSQTDKTWIALVGDIVRRMCILNPLSLHPCLENEGIVIIDALDSQLDSQQRHAVLQRLHHAFPLVQFIVSAHHEDVAELLPEIECYRLHRGQAIALDLHSHQQKLQQLYMLLNLEDESDDHLPDTLAATDEPALSTADILNYAQQLSEVELQQLQQQLLNLSSKQDKL